MRGGRRGGGRRSLGSRARLVSPSTPLGADRACRCSSSWSITSRRAVRASSLLLSIPRVLDHRFFKRSGSFASRNAGRIIIGIVMETRGKRDTRFG